MARRPGFRVQEELLRLLRAPNPRLDQQLSERIRPDLAEIGRTYAGRPPEEIVVALDAIIRTSGGRPDRAALCEFAEEISRRENPFD
jgi:hypothetical protein